MLTQSVLQAAYPVALNLDSRGLKAKAIAGTPLAMLVEASRPDFMYLRGEETGELEINIEQMLNVANDIDPGTGIRHHDEKMDSIVGAVAEAVQNHLLVARTVVAPAIESIVAGVVPAMETLLKRSMNDLEVIPFKLPAPLLEPALIDSINRSKDLSPVTLTGGFSLPARSESQILEMLQTGNPSLDQAIVEWANDLGADKLLDMWTTNFAWASGANASTALVTGFIEDPQITKINTELFRYLIARRIWDNPLEDVDVPLAKYEEYMADLRNNAAVALLGELARVDADEKYGILIRSYGSMRVVVNDRVYRDWLMKGGSNEVLFGNTMLPSPALTVSALEEVADKARENWSQFKLMNKVAEDNNRYNAALAVISTEFNAHISGLTNEELSLDERPLVFKNFEEALKATRQEEISNIYDWVTRLVCASRFRHTDADRILGSLAQVCKANPGIDKTEAAAIAAIEYISYWVSAQMAVCDINSL